MLERFDFQLRHADGSIVIGETQTTAVPACAPGREPRRHRAPPACRNLAALALRDPLTGLANRRLLDELLEPDLPATRRSGLPLAVAFLDLDGLKTGERHLRPRCRRHRAVRDGAPAAVDRALVPTSSPGSVATSSWSSTSQMPTRRRTTSSTASTQRCRSRSRSLPTSPCSARPASAPPTPASIGHDRATLLAAADDAMYEVKRARRGVRGVKSARHAAAQRR